MNWKLTIVLVSAFGIIKEFRPATPFLTPYLISPPKILLMFNFTVPSFFLTDLLRYKPIAITEAVALCVTWILLLWGKTIWQMQIMQIAFGIASACELGYESYMFLIVDKKYYKLVSSYTRAATLIGRFFAYALAQFLVSFNYGSYLLLNQISFGAVCIIIPIAIAFPPITSEIINSKAQGKQTNDKRQTSKITSNETTNAEDFNGTKSENIDKSLESRNASYNMTAYFRFVLKQFKIFKHNKNVLKWSIWWALTSCGIYQGEIESNNIMIEIDRFVVIKMNEFGRVMNYVQSLWVTMQNISDNFNAITECINTFIGAAISFSMQYIRKDWTVHDELILAITSTIIAILLIIMSQSKSVIIAYILYVGVTAVYNLLMTAACATIASELDSASYGFVFGLNTFIALLLETIITFAFADKHGFALSIRNQIPIFFLTDILRHKPVVVLEAVSYCISHVIILWGNKDYRQRRILPMFHICMQSLIRNISNVSLHMLEQPLYLANFWLMDPISFGFGCITLLMACLLPSISSKMITNKNLREVGKCDQIIEVNDDDERVSLNAISPTVIPGMKTYLQDAWTHLMIFKSKTTVFKWCIWWALAGCGTFQVQNYVQNLWALLQENGKAYNGITECAVTLIGAIACFLVQYLKIDWAKCGELVLLINSIISAILLIVMSQTTSAFIAYILYIAFATIYQLLITAASANIAIELTTASYGFIFGFSTFVALFLQTILTLIVVDKHGLALDIRTQFFIYGCYFGAISTIFILMLIRKIIGKVTVFSQADQCPEKDTLT
ncbi:Reduced folate carrier [Dirofilaria immitis]|nr:Reduced folate carrier [Dirofilaria immitis]